MSDLHSSIPMPPTSGPMLSALQVSHLLIGSRLRRGGVAVDATAGNGHDTLFLARTAGPGGRIEAFDNQAGALQATERRLVSAGSDLAAVTLHACGHERAGDVLSKAGVDAIDAAMFNLGYLPGGDKSLTTQPATTLAALASLTQRLQPGGLITIVVYVRHPGGRAECEAVLEWSRALPIDAFGGWHYHSVNSSQGLPELIVVEKTGTGWDPGAKVDRANGGGRRN